MKRQFQVMYAGLRDASAVSRAAAMWSLLGIAVLGAAAVVALGQGHGVRWGTSLIAGRPAGGGFAWLAVLGYLAALAAVMVGCQLGRVVFFTRWAQRAARLGLIFAALAAVSLLGASLTAVHASSVQGWVTAAQASLFVALVGLGVAAPVSVAGAVVVVWRLLSGPHPIIDPDAVVGSSMLEPTPSDEDDHAPGDDCRHVPAEKVWADNGRLPPGRKAGQIGVCLSGGGIRSAAFALGALQVLQEAGQLARAEYLISVSGGGYAAGALQLALQPPVSGRDGPTAREEAGRSASARPAIHPAMPNGPPKGLVDQAPGHDAPARDVFGPGSPEFDHTRRHSRYLAEGGAEWLMALGVLLRGVFAAQVLLFCTVLLLGRALGEIYRQLPTLARPFEALPQPSDLPQGQTAVDYLQAPATGVWAAVAAGFAAAALVWLSGVVLENFRATMGASLLMLKAAWYVAYLAIAMLVVALFLPLLAVAGQEVYGWFATRTPQLPGPGSTAAAGAATVVTTGYIATIAAILLAVGRTARSISGLLKKNTATIMRIPAIVLQWILVLIGVVVLVGSHLYVFAQVFYGTAIAGDWLILGQKWPQPVRASAFWIVLAVFVLLAFAVDQTRWSLQPFYKRRLMTAFAVRRKDPAKGSVAPYDFDRETTWLDVYDSKADGFPQVIFAAAANVSGQELTPPGRRALPYTLSGDWVGSPRLGWIATRDLRGVVSYPFQLDLTVQGAMAVSGAAFASAMGASRRPFSLLLTLTNARLGTWLPNPYYLSQLVNTEPAGDRPAGTKARAANADNGAAAARRAFNQRWARPRPPSWRRLPQLLREIFGMYPVDDRLLLVTDGGHYENLGLVELLRHQPSVAYCLDASGGTTVAGGALGPAIALAYEELGIEISFDTESPDRLSPGSARSGEPQVVADRTAADDVLVGRVTYPACCRCGAQRTGTLYYGRAVLTSTTPWPIRAYASRNSVFPNDRTSDQWFDHEQFDAYQGLGRHVGKRLLARANQTEHAPSTGQHSQTSDPVGAATLVTPPAKPPAAASPQTPQSLPSQRAERPLPEVDDILASRTAPHPDDVLAPRTELQPPPEETP